MKNLVIAPLMFLAIGCVAELGEDEVGLAYGNLDPDECYPRGNRYNCAPDVAVRDRPRVYNPMTRTLEWPIAAGTPLIDGAGTVRGTVTSSAVRVNYGQRKRLRGQTWVYVWAARLDTGIAASGWIPESAVRHRNTLRRRMRTLRLPNPGRGHYRTRWTVTGGDNARFGDLTVTRGFAGGGRRATDYLLRPGNVVNLIYNTPGHELGGYNVDTFAPGVTFRRARGVRQIRTPLYRQGGTTPIAHLHFVYGYIHDGEQRRYGWIPKEALEAAGAPPSSGDTCSVRCCDGHIATGLDASSTRACVQSSSMACEGHDYVLRARLEGDVVYRRARSCWARCNGDARYTRLEGVDEGCTARAAAHCAGRGLEDAMWDSCRPM